MQKFLDTRNAPPVTRLLARMIVDTRFEDLPAETVKATELAFYDWVGCAMVSGQTDKAARMARVAEEEGAKGGALVFADGKRTSPHWAAFANGASHAVELDDVHMASIIHGGIVVCPTALAMAEHTQAGGKKLIEALVVGFDVAYRIGEAIARTHYLMWHSTGTVATFGAAAAAAKIMGLNEDQSCSALGNAASQAAGIWEYLKFGDDTKLLHAGKAAMNGMLAASLARQGFTGSDTGIEGERGFLATMSGSSEPGTVDWDTITRDLGRRFKVNENGYKLHACCRHGHVSIDNALRLVREYDLHADQVKAVRVQMNRNSCETLADSDPVSPYKAKFSLAFFMACCFLRRRVGLEEFTEERLRDPAMRAFMKKVSSKENPEFTRNYPRLWTASLEVELHDGRVLRSQADLPEGDPSAEMPIDQLDQKALTMMGSVVGDDRARSLLSAMQRLSEVQDVSALFEGYPVR